MGNRINILFYAINGTGLGHLNRLLVLARTSADLVRAQGLEADFRFLTTSEADQAVWDFPTYKLPSKTVVAGSDASIRAFESHARFFITNLVAGFRPDILVVDTVPQGSYNEFLFLKDHARATVFIDRHKNIRLRRGATHGATLSLYDLIITPDWEARAAEYPIPGNMQDKRVFTGPIHAFAPERAWSRERVRAYFGAKPHQELIYVSGGGGGDGAAEGQLDVLVRTVAEDPDHLVIVGYGPLFRGKKRYRPNAIALAELDAWRFFPGMDLALCSAGYNAYQELLAAGVPCAFFAQNKGMDRQDQRIDLGSRQGWHAHLEEIEPAVVRTMLHHLKDPVVRDGLAEALARRTPARGALIASVEILRLHASLGGSLLDRTELVNSAVYREAWSHLAAPEGCEFSSVMRQTRYWERLCLSPRVLAQRGEEALMRFAAGPGDPEPFVTRLRQGLELLQLGKDVSLPIQLWSRLLRAYTADLEGAGSAEGNARLHRLTQDLGELSACSDPGLLPAVLEQLLRLIPDLPSGLGVLLEALEENNDICRILERLEHNKEGRISPSALAALLGGGSEKEGEDSCT